MRNWWLTWLVVVIVVASSCGSSDQGEWAREAQAWHDNLRAAQIAQGGSAFASFLDPDVAWDDTPIYADDAGFRRFGDQAIETAGQLLGPESLRLEPDIFISVDGLVDFFFYDWAPLGNDYLPDTAEPAHGVSLMVPIGLLGAESLVNGTAIEDWRDRRPGWPQADQAEALATSWTQVWSGTTDEVDALYRVDARLRDTIAGIDLTGRNAISDLAGAAGQWEITTVGRDAVQGVYPLVRGRSGSKVLEELVVVVAGQDGTGCTGEMLVWLTLDGGLVAEEARYWSIDRARQCLPAADLPDGWWTDHPIPSNTPPTEDIKTLTDPLVVGDTTITVYNGTPALNRLLAWGLGRFETAGFTPPSVASVTFARSSERCDDVRGWYRDTAPGAEIVLCFHEGAACRDQACSYYTPASRLLVLHELAHAWMNATLDDGVTERFSDHVQLDVWNDHDVDWIERAVEHAADTIAWGLMDRELALYRLGNPAPSPDHLAAGYRILTGTDPLPRTDDDSPTSTQPTTSDE